MKSEEPNNPIVLKTVHGKQIPQKLQQQTYRALNSL